MFENIQLLGHLSAFGLYHADHTLSMTQIPSLPVDTLYLPQPQKHCLARINKCHKG